MLRKFLQSLLNQISGLLAIVITDKDGVVIAKVCSRDDPEVSQRSSYIAPFCSATDQATKLGLGPNNTIICFYDKYQVVSINKGAIHLHLVGTAKGNTGDFMSVDQHIEHLIPNLEEMVTVVALQGQGE